jgi:nucleoside-diphosphate-sugar epimerase
MADQRRIVIAGGSGFVGRSGAERLAERGDEVVVLTRSPQHHGTGLALLEPDGSSSAGSTSTISFASSFAP